jgi:hypothetical protein
MPEGICGKAAMPVNKEPITKREAWLSFDGGRGLFEACWRRACECGLPGDMDGVREMLDGLAAELVNDSKSKFYIHG